MWQELKPQLPQSSWLLAPLCLPLNRFGPTEISRRCLYSPLRNRWSFVAENGHLGYLPQSARFQLKNETAFSYSGYFLTTLKPFGQDFLKVLTCFPPLEHTIWIFADLALAITTVRIAEAGA